MDNINTITTNDRFDKLTNLDISTHYRDREYWFMKKDFTSAFAYWVHSQSPYDTPDTTPAIKAFADYVESFMGELVKQFSYEEVSSLITEDILESMPDIAILNERKNGREGMGFSSRYGQPTPDDDFIDLGALARNVFYMILRENITQSY